MVIVVVVVAVAVVVVVAAGIDATGAAVEQNTNYI